jgi:hypothetical protein
MWLILILAMITAFGVCLAIVDVGETLYINYRMKYDGYKLMKDEEGNQWYVSSIKSEDK